MAVLVNLARMTTATTGTGTITLGSAVSGFLTFAAAGVTNGQVVSYGIVDGDNREVGHGTYSSSGTTLTRTVLDSTNSGSALNLSGDAEVFVTALAEDILPIASMTPSSGDFLSYNGSAWASVDAAATRAALDLEVGTDVQAYSGDLAAIAALSPAEGDVLTYSGGVWTAAPASGGGMSLPGGMTQDPRLLPCYDSTAGLSVNIGTTSTLVTTANTNFWNELGLIGAVATSSSGDTYTTICDITGSGVMFHVVSQAIANTTDDVTFRITVDGTVYTMAKSQTWLNAGGTTHRIVLGAAVNATYGGTLFTTASSWINDFAGGSVNTQAFRKTAASTVLLPPSNVMSLGWPCLRFTQSLKVEVKVSSVAAATYAGYCAATYILD